MNEPVGTPEMIRDLISINNRQIATNLKLMDEIQSLTDQRNVLLATCQNAERWLSNRHYFPPILESLRAAIVFCDPEPED